MGKFLDGLCDVIEATNKALAESAKKKKQLMYDTADIFLRLIENIFDEKLIEQKLKSQLEVINPTDRRIFLEELEVLVLNKKPANYYVTRNIIIRVATGRY